MDELTKTMSMNIIPEEDMQYLATRSKSELNIILSGMTSLMRDTDIKVQELESQPWYVRMLKTVTGSNKATREQIARNHDRLNAYVTQALSLLFDRQLIDEKLIMTLGVQIKMLYADHIQAKKQMGAIALKLNEKIGAVEWKLNEKIERLRAQLDMQIITFADKLNEKIESVDNFHLLVEEIDHGYFSKMPPLLAICEIMSMYDHRITQNDRKLSVLEEAMKRQKIISDDEITVTEYLHSILEIPEENVGQVMMELNVICDNSPMARVLRDVANRYYYLPIISQKMKNKDIIVENVIKENELNGDFTISTRVVYSDFLQARQDLLNIISNATDDYSSILELAMDNYEARNYEVAFACYATLSERCDDFAMLELGELYERGLGVAQDNYKALEQYNCAITKGSVCAIMATYRAARVYEKQGEITKALQLYETAAEEGNTDAMCRLGDIYREGECGVEADADVAESWYEKGSEKDHIGCVNRLADLCVAAYNIDEAKSLYRKNVAKGDLHAIYKLGYLLSNYSSRNYVEAVQCLQKAAEAGSGDAMYELAQIYKYGGDGISKDPLRAAILFARAIDIGVGGMYAERALLDMLKKRY